MLQSGGSTRCIDATPLGRTPAEEPKTCAEGGCRAAFRKGPLDILSAWGRV